MSISRPLRAVAAVLCCLLLFCGCAGNSASRSIIMAAPASSQPSPERAEGDSEAQAAPLKPDEPIALTTIAPNLSGTFVGGESGCYNVRTFNDGTADLVWFDYAALTMTTVENPPKANPNHLGHIPDSWGGVSPLLAGEHLYLFRLGGASELIDTHGEAGQAAIMRLGLNATDPIVTTLPAHYSFQSGSAVLSDGTSFYFLMNDASGEAVATVLMQLDCETMETTELHRLPEGLEYTIEGSWDKGPVLCGATPLPPLDHPDFPAAWSARRFRLINLGLQSGVQQVIHNWTQGQTSCMQQDTLYYWDDATGELKALNANTLDIEVLASGFAPNGYLQAQLSRTVLDGKLRIQFSTNGPIQYFFVDIATGAAEATPVANLGNNLSVYAETPDAFLMQSDSRYARREEVDPLYDPETNPASSYNDQFVTVPVYGLIAKGDYWAGTPNFTDIEDLVYI